MVRTSGGVRISAGKSSKKGGGGASTGGGSRSTSAGSGGKSSNKGSNRLPPIPHCEAPSWQKPITSFFNSGVGTSKDEDMTVVHDEEMKGKEEKVEHINEIREVTAGSSKNEEKGVGSSKNYEKEAGSSKNEEKETDSSKNEETEVDNCSEKAEISSNETEGNADIEDSIINNKNINENEDLPLSKKKKVESEDKENMSSN